MTIKASSAVPVSGTLGDWLNSLHRWESVRAVSSHPLFSTFLFLDRVVTDVLEDHEGTGDA